MKKSHCSAYAPTVLRLFIGLLFIVPGFLKLSNPAGIIGMLGQLGIPASAFLGWVLILSEIVFGITVLVGFRLNITVWPLVVVLLVALWKVHLPAIAANPINVLFHLLGIGALVSLYLSGPGEWKLDLK